MAEQLGRFALLNRIGSGGMAEVFLARGPAGMCVVKRMHQRIAEDPDLVRMFLDEASLAAQLSHPGIARVFDLGENQGSYFFAMEYVPGFDLFTILQEQTQQQRLMAPEVAARVVSELAAALHHAHEAVGARGQKLGIIHRDVSPQNILISTMGQVKLIDFGVARATSKLHQTRAGLVKGKAAYMAPEQVVGAAIDRRVDIYALGLVLFELLTNRRAIQGEQEMELILNARAGKLHALSEFRADVPQPLQAVLARCIAFKADQRFPTADAVRGELDAWLASCGRPAGRDQLAGLLAVVPADPTHAVEAQGRTGRAGESTLRPQVQAPGGKVTDDTLRANRRISTEQLMKVLMEDGGKAEARTDVERKALVDPARRGHLVVPQDLDDDEAAPTVFEPGGVPGSRPARRGGSSPTLLGGPDLGGQLREDARALGPPTVKAQPAVSEEEARALLEPADAREHVTERPEGPDEATARPARALGPMLVVLALALAVLAAVVFALAKTAG